MPFESRPTTPSSRHRERSPAGFVMTRTPPSASSAAARRNPGRTGRARGFRRHRGSSFLSSGEQVRSSESAAASSPANSPAPAPCSAESRLHRPGRGRRRSRWSRRSRSRRGPHAPVVRTSGLPPADGDYPALLGPAWQPGRRPEPASHPSTVSIVDGSVSGQRPEWPLPERVRVVLLDRPRRRSCWRLPGSSGADR